MSDQDTSLPGELSAAEAAVVVATGRASIVDVREQVEWDAGHIAGALLLPLSELTGRLGELPDGDLVIVCRSGARSEMVCSALIQSGRAAANLIGGMLAWAGAELPIEPPGGHVL
ncbi:MAG TPA: rhodanese-like domain-containing protein [Gaiellales bacterium]|nr:rhodanese-like domain-containing protein [Gaiellales bacterium]